MSKKLFLIALAVLCLAPSLNAQVAGWPRHSSHEEFIHDRENGTLTIDKDYYSWKPFGSEVGYAIYGSRYRKAIANKRWGIFLSCMVAPVAGVAVGCGLDSGGARQWVCCAGAGLVLGGILGVSIPMWSKGQKELDLMLDDYVQHYGPKPRAANLTAGPTANGIGLALNF
jgi:hypothetical protein